MSLLHELKRRNVLRVALAYLAGAWLIIQIAEILFPLFGLPESMTRAVVIVIAVGFIPILVMTWVFEFTPDGLILDKDVTPESRPASSAKRFDRVVIALMAAALLFFGVDKFVLDPARDEVREEQVAQEARTDALIDSFGDRSIAVLPFVNMSDDESNEYFADGISEELLNLLAKIDELRVISRSSTFALKGQDIDIPTIGQQLNVVHVLEGSVRKAGNQVRITAQLIDARTDTHLWSETYDRALDDIFTIQDEIAAEVVDQLQITLGLDEASALPAGQVVSAEAYDHYLRGLQAFGEGTIDGYRRAEEEFQAAITLDEGYADAMYRLARTQMELSRPGIIEAEIAVATANKTLELDPENGGALMTLSLLPGAPSDRLERLAMRRQAYEWSPGDSYVVLHYGRGFEQAYRKHDADTFFQRALDLDPLNVEMQTIYGLFNMFRGRAQKSLQVFDRIIEIDPDYARAHANKGFALGNFNGDVAGAIISLMNGVELDPERHDWEARIAGYYLALGDLDSANGWLNRASVDESNSGSNDLVRTAYLYLSGQKQEAVSFASEQIEKDTSGFPNSSYVKLVVNDYLREGRVDEARLLLESMLPTLDEFLEVPPPGSRMELFDADISLGVVRQLQIVDAIGGNDSRSLALVDRLRLWGLEGSLTYDFEPTPRTVMDEARKLMRERQPAAAIKALQMAVAIGYRASANGFGWQFDLLIDPVFAEIRGEPEFQELISIIETDMVEQRARLERELANRL